MVLKFTHTKGTAHWRYTECHTLSTILQKSASSILYSFDEVVSRVSILAHGYRECKGLQRTIRHHLSKLQMPIYFDTIWVKYIGNRIYFDFWEFILAIQKKKTTMYAWGWLFITALFLIEKLNQCEYSLIRYRLIKSTTT